MTVKPFTQDEIDYHAHQGRMNYLRVQCAFLDEKKEILEDKLNSTVAELKETEEKMRELAKEFSIRKANKSALEEIERLKALLAEKTKT